MAIPRIAKLFFFAAILVLCSITAAAQGTAHYSTQVNSFQYNDSTPDCTSAKNKVCFTTVSTSPAIESITAGADGAAFGLQANGSVWTIPALSSSWQSTSLSPMVQISAATADSVYGLQYDATYCISPQMRAYLYSGSGNFAPLNFCANYIAAAQDGTIYRILNGAVSHRAPGSTTWTSDPTAGGNGTPVEIAVGSQFNVWIITSTQVIKTLDLTSGGFDVVAGAATHVSTSGDPTQSTEETWVVNSSLNVFKYSSSTGSPTGTWTQMAGNLTGIAAGNHYFVFGVRSDLSTTYHFNAIQIMANIATTGYYSCSPQCPPGAVHTATVQGAWVKGGVGANGSNAGPPQATLNALASPYTDDCDPIFGPTSDACSMEVQGNVDCSAMGVLFFSDPLEWSIETEGAYTRVIANGAMKGCKDVLGVSVCQQPVTSWCSNTATPDLNPTIIETGPPQWTYTWDDNAVCFRLNEGGYHSPWDCTPGVAIRNGTIDRALCTYNP